MRLYREKVYRKNPDADAERLKRIANKCNWFISSGQRIPVTIGHTEDNPKPCGACDGMKQAKDGSACEACDGRGFIDASVEFLPVDVGSLDNFSEDGEYVYADMDLDDAFADAIKRHRGKSAELWNDDLLFPLSLLSHNRPAMMLGPTKYQREGEHSTFTLNDEDTAMDATAIENLVSECLLSSELMAQMRALTESVAQLSVQCASHSEFAEKMKWLMDDSEEVPGEEPIDGATGGGEGEGEGEIDKNAMPEGEGEKPAEAPAEAKPGEGEKPPMAEEGKEGKQEGEEKKVEKNDMALASGTNTFVPSTDVGGAPANENDPENALRKRKKYEELELESTTYRMEAENQKKLVADYAAQVAAVADEKNAAVARTAELEGKYKMLSRKNEMIVLSGKYLFDPEKEMEIVATMDDEQYAKHKDVVIVKRYAMPPVNRAPISVGELAQPKGPEPEVVPREQVQKVVKYCLDKVKGGDMSYNGANGFKKAYQEIVGKPAP